MGYSVFTEVNNIIWKEPHITPVVMNLMCFCNIWCFLYKIPSRIEKKNIVQSSTRFPLIKPPLNANNKSYLISFNLLFCRLSFLSTHKKVYPLNYYIELPFHNNFVKNIIFHKSNHKRKGSDNRTIFIMNFCYDRHPKK